MKIILETTLICTASKREYNISSKELKPYREIELTFIIYSEAMQMILSADNPDSEDLNDQKYLLLSFIAFSFLEIY
jgi:hypothetical protein